VKPKLIESIKATETGNRAPTDRYDFIQTKSYLNDHAEHPVRVDYAKEYRVGVQLGTYVFIPEDEYAAIRLGRAQKEVGHMICREVYGEIREELIKLRYDLYNALGFQSRDIIEKLDSIIEMTHYD